MEEAKAQNHQSVNWYAYFKSIREDCPWSYAAYIKGQIDIQDYQGIVEPLGTYQARIYIVHAPDETVEALAAGLDYNNTEDEWLFSYPGYGPYAAPVSILIQQNRQRLEQLRNQNLKS